MLVDHYLFLVFHFPVFSKEVRVTTPSQVSVFIGKNYLITLHKGELKPLSKLFRECQIDEESREEYFSHGSGYLPYVQIAEFGDRGLVTRRDQRGGILLDDDRLELFDLVSEVAD